MINGFDTLLFWQELYSDYMHHELLVITVTGHSS